MQEIFEKIIEKLEGVDLGGISDAELLQFAIENGMLDTALVQKKIEMQKSGKVRECTIIKYYGTRRRAYSFLRVLRFR